MLQYHQSLGAALVLATLGACGSVNTPATADAAVDAVTGEGAGSNTGCTPGAVITDVEDTMAGFGNGCIRGGWTLEAFNGTTTPVAAGQPDHTTLVAPVAIAAGSNRLDQQSTFAIHVSGRGQHNAPPDFSYAQLAASLNQPNGDEDPGTVDASAYTGIKFYGKLSAGMTGIRLTVANVFTDPVGGKCTPDGAEGVDCYDDAGFDLAMAADWNEYKVPFASLMQLGYGYPSPTGAAFPKDAIFRIQWEVGIPDTGDTAAWELWIDDLRFY